MSIQYSYMFDLEVANAKVAPRQVVPIECKGTSLACSHYRDVSEVIA